MTLLHQATFLRKWRWVNLLRKHEANSNAVDLFRWTPLHYHAAVNSNAYGRLSAIEPISLLITAVSVNAQDLSGFTPLHYAAQSGSVDLVTLLLSKSADLSIRGRKGEVPLALAARNGHTKVVEALLDEGDIEQDHVNQVDNGGRTPLHWAASYGHYDVVKRLIDKDAKKQAPDAKKRSPLHYLAFYKLGSRKKNTLIEIDRLALLLDDKTSDFPKDYIEQTPLHLAACTENADIVRILLQRNPDVDMVDLNGRTPLHISARAGNYEITALLLEK
ncbi:ankyrin repeat-containing domain protein, partial [Peziza echinospora]